MDDAAEKLHKARQIYRERRIANSCRESVGSGFGIEDGSSQQRGISRLLQRYDSMVDLDVDDDDEEEEDAAAETLQLLGRSTSQTVQPLESLISQSPRIRDLGSDDGSW